MPDYMTREARAVAIRAFEHAIRLGHCYLGGEHFLLSLAGCDEPAGAVLREHGVTPERVENEIARLAAASLFGDLDNDALAAIGIDVNAVLATIEASFAPAALSHASQAVRRAPRLPRLDPRRVSGAERGGVFLPHARDVEQSLRNARSEAQARRDTQIGVEHLAVGLLAASEGAVPGIVSALDGSALTLRTAILDRYRRAG